MNKLYYRFVLCSTRHGVEDVDITGHDMEYAAKQVANNIQNNIEKLFQLGYFAKVSYKDDLEPDIIVIRQVGGFRLKVIAIRNIEENYPQYIKYTICEFPFSMSDNTKLINNIAAELNFDRFSQAAMTGLIRNMSFDDNRLNDEIQYMKKTIDNYHNNINKIKTLITEIEQTTE